MHRSYDDRQMLQMAASALTRDDADVVERLRAIGTIRRLLPQFEEEVVRRARMRKCTWATIAFWMGVSHQAVIKRWRRRVHGDGYDPMSSRRRPDRLPPRGPAPPRLAFWNTP